jgi:hypothetical protein
MRFARLHFLLISVLLTGCLFEEDPSEPEGDPEKKDNACVISGHIVLETQSEVDSFAAIIDTCDKVSVVYLWIMGEGIVSLEGFKDKFSVIKSLQVTNTSLRTLKGLGTIDTITELKLADNPHLDSLAITISDSVIFEIDLRNNLQLKHINELESLKTVFYFRLSGGYISSINGLRNLERLAYYIIIESNPSLTSLTGLESLHSRFTDYNYSWDERYDPPMISIVGNPGLTDFCAISHLTGNEDFQLNISVNGYNPTLEDFQDGRCKPEK